MSNLINVIIKREQATSIQQTISMPIINKNEVHVVCYDNSTDEEVLRSVMFAIDDSELLDGIYELGYKDAVVNGKNWSISNCEFRN